jgi:hypothetical protein
MKYIIDVDALIKCLECVEGMRINNKDYVQVELVQEFIRRFPKDEPTALNASPELEKQA